MRRVKLIQKFGDTVMGMTAREMLFRAVCQHRQGERRNILAYCSRRSGSTWLTNTIAAHSGCRYVGKMLLAAQGSRWRRQIPNLNRAAGYEGSKRLRQVVGFENEDLAHFESFCRNVIDCRYHLYPTLNFSAPYFHRVTDRVVFKMTTGMPMIEWFHRTFPVMTVVLVRHPVSTSLSVMERSRTLGLGWEPEPEEFLVHQGYVRANLTGEQTDFAWSIVRHGSLLERHILDWALKYLIPIKALASGRHPDWLMLTYEEMTVYPEEVVRLISERLELPDVASMLAQIRRPSRNVTANTANHVADPDYLIRRWRQRVSREDETRAFEILSHFGINIYEPGRDFAQEKFLHFGAGT